MITVIPFEDLGRFDHDWLSARYHFSFAEYHHPDRMGFGPLRVWNDDTIRPGGGFPFHGHRDMEIITYVRQGAVSHEDNQGNKGRTEAGQVQVMSAGSGIVHSEFNEDDEQLRLFQIWLRPDKPGHAPRWDTRSFSRDERDGRLVPLVSGRDDMDGALFIHQDATLYAADLEAGQSVSHELEPGRRAYLVAARGSVVVDGVAVPTRAGARIEGVRAISIVATEDSEVVLLDLI